MDNRPFDERIHPSTVRLIGDVRSMLANDDSRRWIGPRLILESGRCTVARGQGVTENHPFPLEENFSNGGEGILLGENGTKELLNKRSESMDAHPLLVKPLKDVFIKLPGSVERDLLVE